MTVTPQKGSVNLFVLQPKSKSLRRRVTQMDLHIHEPSGRMLQTRTVQADGAVVTLTFEPPQPISAAESARRFRR